MSKKKLPWANKKLGQHFLTSEKVINSICEKMEGASAIIEVGPGPGILTEHLSSLDLPFHVIEKDTRFEEYLEQWLAEDQITFGDGLKVNLTEMIKEKGWDDNVWLVSNLPYNVGVPLMINFIKTPAIKYMTLMFQKEVGEKIVGDTANSLMALSNNYFDCSLLCKVPPGAFTPPPQVDSIVVTLKRKDDPVVPLNKFKNYENFLRLLFSQRRKQLGSVLKKRYSNYKEVLEECQIDTKIRPETFKIEEIQLLYQRLEDRNGN